MDREEFKKQVNQELEKLNLKQTVAFAWRCAVRALPFLGTNCSFDFWKKKNRQMYIYAVFYALDVKTSAAVLDASVAANDAALAAYNAGANSAANAVLAATNAVHAVHAAANANANVANAAALAVNAAFDTKNDINLERIILQDLNSIQKMDGGIHHKHTDLYGEIWDNFQKALEAEGCSYWGQLYKSIFENGISIGARNP